MQKRLDLGGIWTGQAKGLGTFQVTLPGTLDTNRIGGPDEEGIRTRLTRLHTYEGRVRYARRLHMPKTQGGRLFLRVERTRELLMEIDGCAQEPFREGTLSTPWLFEVTAFSDRDVELAFTVDNAYTRWPRSSIIGASAATDETQTNWNGILGDFGIYEEGRQFFESLRVYSVNGTLSVRGRICGLEAARARLEKPALLLESEALAGGVAVLSTQAWLFGETDCEIRVDGIPLADTCERWDEGAGKLYALRAVLCGGKDEACGEAPNDAGADEGLAVRQSGGKDAGVLAQTETTFGVRDFGVDEGLRLTLNGRRIFLRGEANCCVFPQEGHPPMDEERWRSVLEAYAAYGVNCMRFHSWCPPDAAFAAADQMGMLMQPELSHWNFKDAFGDEKARDYYRRELYAVLDMLANHPSFVMLTFGNELNCTEEGDAFAGRLLDEARAYDPTRLYANASNYRYGEEGTDPGSDFYTAMAYRGEMLRATSSPMAGHLNEAYPSACRTYDAAVEQVHREKKPLFGFEVGQYEILPDFSQVGQFSGVTRAVNLERIREEARERGLLFDWPRMVEATGELALLCYREEVEAALRTKGMSGLSLLGLQDFPGQGTALVGMMDSHLKPKPYAFAKPQRFRAFFGQTVPLLYLKKYTYVGGDLLEADVKLAHYGSERLVCTAGWELLEDGGAVESGTFPAGVFEAGKLCEVGALRLRLPEPAVSRRFGLRIFAGAFENCYPLWVYADREPEDPGNVLVEKRLSASVLAAARAGRTVFLEPQPDEKHIPASVEGHFTTDFWSVGTFPEQSGTMGMLIDRTHPALAEFPTEFYCNYQWWPMANGRPMILPGQIRPIVAVPDCCSRLRHLGLLFEASFGAGRIMVSAMGLTEKQQHPECRALLRSLLHYLDREARSGRACGQRITEDELRQIVAYA